MVKEMCSAAGIKGHKTNHSLRATAATKLFHAGIDEQLIMERTGHHSVDGVRSYKRTSQQQVEVLSDVLNLSAAKTPKRVKVDTQQQESIPPLLLTSTSKAVLIAQSTCSTVQTNSRYHIVNKLKTMLVYHLYCQTLP